MSLVDAVRAHNLIGAGERVAVAVSGGADSMALLSMLLEKKEELGCSVTCVHVEHGIRGEASLADRAFVEEYCKKGGVPFLCFSVDAPGLRASTGKTLEQAARDARYEIFYRLIREGKADKVAVAHHADDNAESVLMHLLRGCGVSGAAGMAYDNGAGVIRPLLGMKKADLIRYLAERGVPFREDGTNRDTAYTRNFVRHELLPLAESRFPGARENLLRFAAAAAEDDAYLTGEARKLLAPIRGGFAIERESFLRCRPLAFRALRLCCRALGVYEDVEAVHFAAVCSLAERGRRGSFLTLPHGIRAYRDGDTVAVLRLAERDAPETAPLREGEVKLLGRAVRVEPAACLGKEPGALYAADGPLLRCGVWRARKAGDTFRPYGGRTKKLNDYLSEKRVPPRERDSVPVLAVDSRVLAVAGLEIADCVKVEPNSKILKITTREDG